MSSYALTFAFMALPVWAQQAPKTENPYLENVTADNAIFIAVDYLTGFQPAIRTMDKTLYQNNLTGLSKMVKAFGLPTIVLGDEGGPRGTFMPQMKTYFADAPFIARTIPSAWREQAFVEAVKATERKKTHLRGYFDRQLHAFDRA